MHLNFQHFFKVALFSFSLLMVAQPGFAQVYNGVFEVISRACGERVLSKGPVEVMFDRLYIVEIEQEETEIQEGHTQFCRIGKVYQRLLSKLEWDVGNYIYLEEGPKTPFKQKIVCEERDNGETLPDSKVEKIIDFEEAEKADLFFRFTKSMDDNSEEIYLYQTQVSSKECDELLTYQLKPLKPEDSSQ
jgi:hypothetical protein